MMTCNIIKIETEVHMYSLVGENIIATTIIKNDYGANYSNFKYCDSNIGLFSIALCKVITLNPLCILFCIISLLLF